MGTRVILFWVLAILLNACGAGDTTISPTDSLADDSPTSQDTPLTIEVDAGVNKRVVINESVTIEGTIQIDESDDLTYEWREQEEVLATTKIFTFTPTVAGTYLLSFVVQNGDGVLSSDEMRVIVTNKEINTTIPKISDALISEYLTAVNKARTTQQDCGSKGLFSATTTLQWNEKLYKAAYEHMQDLISSETFSHDGSGTESDWSGYVLGKKSTQVERIESYGYNWQRLGENLAGGNSINTAEVAVEAWLESDNHCENLMNPLFNEVGMVMLTDENALYINYWGQNFGTQK